MEQTDLLPLVVFPVGSELYTHALTRRHLYGLIQAHISPFETSLQYPFTVTSNLQEKTSTLTADLQNAGLRTTLPRLKVLSILETSETRHMSAEDVYREVLKDNEPVGLATVYRVLSQFVEAGLVVRHQFEGDKSVFELNDAAHHDHMVCVKCGLVIEFMNREIELLQEQVAKKHNFDLQEHSLTLYGLCGKCSEAT